MTADALDAALALLKTPARGRDLRRLPLPQGISFVLELANAEPEALAQARRRTGYPDAFIEEAAAFFIEQILLDRRADSYRLLGGSPHSTHAELRRNMALLMRWLHPDRKSQRSTLALDREVFAGRVSRAWENVKSEERRASYDAQHAAASHTASVSTKGTARPTAPFRAATRLPVRRPVPHGMHLAGWPRARPVSWWRRILGFLRGQR